MTTITILTRQIIFDKDGNKTSDVIYYWLIGEKKDLMELRIFKKKFVAKEQENSSQRAKGGCS